MVPCLIFSSLIKEFFFLISGIIQRSCAALIVGNGPISETMTGFDLSFSSAVLKCNPFTTLFWVNKDGNMLTNKFSRPTGQYISHRYSKQIYCQKLYILRPNQHLFEFSNNNSRIKCKMWSELTIEATDVLVSFMLTLDIDDTFLVFFFVVFEHVIAGWNTFALI